MQCLCFLACRPLTLNIRVPTFSVNLLLFRKLVCHSKSFLLCNATTIVSVVTLRTFCYECLDGPVLKHVTDKQCPVSMWESDIQAIVTQNET